MACRGIIFMIQLFMMHKHLYSVHHVNYVKYERYEKNYTDMFHSLFTLGMN